MTNPRAFPPLDAMSPARAAGGLRVGIDITEVRVVDDALREFGERYLQRIFRDDEVRYAVSAPTRAAERLAARFAAKEAAMKAFDWSEAGVAWRDIAVRRESSGRCALELHGRAAELARASGCDDIALSLSHDGDYAAAVVVASPRVGASSSPAG